ncbi:hypothetical protein LguiB_021132 [Lonicera macranthoides]
MKTMRKGDSMSKFQVTNGVFFMQKYKNSSGFFISVAMLKGGTVEKTIVIPAGKSGEGWEGVASAVENVLTSCSWFSLVLQCTASFTAAHLELQQFNQLCAQVLVQAVATQDLNIAITPQILRPDMTSHSHLIAITQLHLQPFRQQICSLSSKSLVRTYMAFFIIEECQHLRPPTLEGANPLDSQAHGLSGLGISIPLGRKLTH